MEKPAVPKLRDFMKYKFLDRQAGSKYGVLIVVY
jgi:hypothetical protein